MGACRYGMSKDEYRAWKQEKRAEWQARKAEWRSRPYQLGYGWHPANIAAMVVGFIVFFPIGLGILFWNIWSSKQVYARSEPAFTGMSMPNFGFGGTQTERDLARNSGNRVFEDYKKATLDRLEEERRKLVAEQEAFARFLDDLRHAKDRDEFERFMRDREANRPAAPDAGAQQTPGI
jgi:hypothetical protein